MSKITIDFYNMCQALGEACELHQWIRDNYQCSGDGSYHKLDTWAGSRQAQIAEKLFMASIEVGATGSLFNRLHGQAASRYIMSRFRWQFDPNDVPAHDLWHNFYFNDVLDDIFDINEISQAGDFLVSVRHLAFDDFKQALMMRKLSV